MNASVIRVLTVGAARAAMVVAVVCGTAMAGDWPHWGGTASRNMISQEKGLPKTFQAGGRPYWTHPTKARIFKLGLRCRRQGVRRFQHRPVGAGYGQEQESHQHDSAGQPCRSHALRRQWRVACGVAQDALCSLRADGKPVIERRSSLTFPALMKPLSP